MNQYLQGIGRISQKLIKWLRVGKLQFNFQQGKGFLLNFPPSFLLKLVHLQQPKNPNPNTSIHP